MTDQDDEQQRIALVLLAFIIAVAAAVGVGTGVWKSRQHQAVIADAATLYRSLPVLSIYFETGSATLPPEAADAIAQMTELSRGYAGATVLVSGFHDATGDPARNAELAKQRAIAVQQALLLRGVAAERVELAKPAETLGGSDERQARRVELRLK